MRYLDLDHGVDRNIRAAGGLVPMTCPDGFVLSMLTMAVFGKPVA